VRAFGGKVFDVIEATPDQLREVDGIGRRPPREAVSGARLCDVLHHPGFRVHAQRYRRPHAGKSLADKVERWLTTRGFTTCSCGTRHTFL